MSLHPVYGHDDLRARVVTSLQARRLPPALLLTGPAGIGKQRLGLWIAQGLLCEQGPDEPCGSCQSCRMVAQLAHPDLHWFFPILRPKGDEAKQVEEAEELIAAAVAARREQPLYGPSDGLAGLFLPLVRVLHRRAQLRPAMARVKVFLIGEAERLVPQASSQEAANAMLKVLEEPPPDTWFILTTAEPAALLPTIRSRLVPLRVGRLPAAEVARFLREIPQPPLGDREAAHRAEMAGGSIGAALAMQADTATTERAQALLAAARTPASRWRYALGVKPFGARGGFTDALDAAAEVIRDDLAARLQQGAAGEEPASRMLAQLREIERVRRAAQGNVNPQLLAADLLRRLASTE